MKEIGTEDYIPEIKDIIETKMDESGVRLYKICWKTSWISEGCLQRYKEQLAEFWRKREKVISMDEQFKGETKTEEDQSSEEKEQSEYDYNDEQNNKHNVSAHQSKRKCSWNLEDIVLKLKRSKNNNNERSKSPELPLEDPKEEEDEYALSPVFPRDMNDDEEKYFEQKSSLLTQLEQKDNMILMESYERELSPERKPSDEQYSSNDDSNEGVEEQQISMHRVSEKGDSQLTKLLEEEKNIGSEGGSDKIDETKCNKCSKRFYRRSQLIRHLSNHVVHECLQCNAVFYCVKKFKKHMSTHETYPCDFCSEEFYDASAWYKHRAKHTMVECSCCDMIFYNKTALAKHKFEHSEYVCPLCRYACENLHYWISHRNYHGRCSLLQPIIACKECKSTFGSQEAFLKHKCCHSKQTLDNSNLPSPKNSSKLYSSNLHSPTESSTLTQTYKPFLPQKQLPPKMNSKIKRPEPIYLPNQRSKLHLHSFPQKPFQRMLDKKNIKDMIGVDQTLTCSS